MSDAVTLRQQTAMRVAARKIDLARWLDQFSPMDQIEARIAMLELAVETMVETYGAYDTGEVVTAALCKATPGHQGGLQ